MRELVPWMMGHPIIIAIAGLALAQLAALVTLSVTARRVRLMKKEMDKVGKQVKNYMDIVLENVEEEPPEVKPAAGRDMMKDEEENRIISTVLQEIFP